MAKPIIQFHSLHPTFRLKHKKHHVDWLLAAVESYGCTVNNIQYIFCTDDYLLEINQNHLQHDTFTDIITFPYSQAPNPIESDIYISIERVVENAQVFGQLFEEELRRVIVHGLLHLIGFTDHTSSEKDLMRKEETRWLKLYAPVPRGTSSIVS